MIFDICIKEFDYLGMRIDASKSCCIRFGGNVDNK